jgi:hypothetical protein
MRLLLVAALAALALPAAGIAGGFATVQLSSLPDGSTTWTPELTVLQHGRTPLDGLAPTIRITNGVESRVFDASPTGAPGRYRAEVTFPSPGTWRYEIWDGFTQTHTYAPVAIQSAGEGDRVPWAPVIAGSAAATFALAAVAAFVLSRRRGGPQARPA